MFSYSRKTAAVFSAGGVA